MRLDECKTLEDVKKFEWKRSAGPYCMEGCFFTVELHPENLRKGFNEVVKVIQVPAPGTSFLVSKDGKFTWSYGSMNKDFSLPLFTSYDEAVEHGAKVLKQAFFGVSKDIEEKMEALGKKHYE